MVTYVHTSDPEFVAPSGRRVGDLLEIDHSQLVRAPGFEIYARAPVAGWATVVGFNGKVTVGSGGAVAEDLDALLGRGVPLRVRITGFTLR